MKEINIDESMRYVNEHVGRRYWSCSFENFACVHPDQFSAVEACRDYVANFASHVRTGSVLSSSVRRVRAKIT